MCGIYGFFDPERRPAPAGMLDRMARTIRHRGPDGHGFAAFDGCALGNQRLSIIDVEGGHQPVWSEDRTIAAVQNGEIYNYVELAGDLARDGWDCRTRSDTEVLLRLYQRDGTAFLDKLNGMFCVAVYDASLGRLFLARDRMGVKPLYLAWHDGRLLFASEIKSLLQAGAPRRLDPEALHQYLTYGYVPPPWTMFEGVRHLMPGHAMTLDPAGCREWRWWDLTSQQAAPIGEEEWIARFRHLIDDAVRLRMRADVPFGAFLSGGLDSSTVVRCMTRHQTGAVKTFSIGFEDPRFDESPFSSEVAGMLGTEHTLEIVDPNMVELWPRVVYHCDQPHSDVSFLPMVRLSELAVRHVKMVLTGDGGDELFGGYTKYSDFFDRPGALDAPEAAFRQRYHAHIALLSEAEKRSLYTTGTARRVAGLDSQEVTDAWLDRAPHWDRINQALWLDVALLLPGNNLVKPDRTTMSVSLEARDPFLDPRLAEFAFQTPGAMKVRPGETRYAYKLAVERDLGAALTHRRKQMFTVPIGEWFKHRLRDFCDRLLLSDRATAAGVFRREAVADMLASHQSGAANHTRQIRMLVAFEIWRRIFLEGDFDRAPSFEEIGVETAAAGAAP
jgi:asparagine synthase (glutamine-hydrolysing)